MIEASFITLEDGTRSKFVSGVTGETNYIYEGTPCVLESDGTLRAGKTGTDVCYGISKIDSNLHKDLAVGEYGSYGTGKVTVVCKGIVRVAASVFGRVEFSASPVEVSETINIFDTSKSYLPGEALFIDNAGLITNVIGSATSSLGRVIAPCASGSQWLEFEVNPGYSLSEAA